MIIGTPKEIKIKEFRVGLIPASVHELTRLGHEVWIETGAGHGIGASDADYIQAGAKIASTLEEVYAKAQMIVKVKEPQEREFPLLRADQILFTYLHLAPDPLQAEALLQSGCIAIAYETVTDKYGRLPLLRPMSEVAGRFSVQIGMYYLQKQQGGAGLLLGAVPGVLPGQVLVVGGGAAGTEAIKVALGVGASTTVVDRCLTRLRELQEQFGPALKTLYSLESDVARAVAKADLVVGAVLVPGATAPKVISRRMVQSMRPGSVVVDIAIDQGGCLETSRPTSFDDPIFVEEGVIHYCVTNMPGAVPRTSTFALNHATLPFILALASKGAEAAMGQNPHLLQGLNVYKGHIAHQEVADALGLPCMVNPF